MLKMSVVFLLLVSFNSLANQQNYQKIKKVKPLQTECVLEDLNTAGLGDVKYSVLSEAQFQAVNGAEWVLLKGQSKTSLGITTEPSVFDYMTSNDNTSTTVLPDARGAFLRMKDFGTGVNPGGDFKIGQYQADEFKSHNHIQGSATLNNSTYSRYGTSGISTSVYQTASGGTGYYPYTSSTGGAETRPKNITINIFVKVKQKCLDAVALAERRAAEARLQVLEDYILKNTCEACLTLPESNLTELQAKNACFKTEVDTFEADNYDWSVTCQSRMIGESKRVLMSIGANNRTQAEEDFLSHLDNQYPYYNVIETN